MRVTPIRPIAPTARTLARRPPPLPQRNLSNDSRARTDPNPNIVPNRGRANRHAGAINIEV